MKWILLTKVNLLEKEIRAEVVVDNGGDHFVVGVLVDFSVWGGTGFSMLFFAWGF